MSCIISQHSDGGSRSCQAFVEDLEAIEGYDCLTISSGVSNEHCGLDLTCDTVPENVRSVSRRKA